MGLINFSKDDFSSLSLTEFLGQWNQVGLDDLLPKEQEFMSVFLQYCCSFDDENLDTSDILLVKAGDYGVLKDVYGPSIFRNENDELVLKCGVNEFPVTHVSKDEFKCGALEGSITFDTKATKVKVKTDGEEYEVEFYPAVIAFIPNDGVEWQFNVRCSLDPATEVSSTKIKNALRRGESIAHHFRPVPKKGEGGNTIKMQELGEGEFPISGIRKVETQNGDRYIIELASGESCWSRGNVETVLKDDESRGTIEAALKADKPVTLSVTSVTQKGDKCYVDCALRFREPRNLEDMKAQAKTKKKSAPQTKEAQAGNKVLATAAAAGKKVLTAAVLDDSELPF